MRAILTRFDDDCGQRLAIGAVVLQILLLGQRHGGDPAPK
jgi:hypothetical protein